MQTHRSALWMLVVVLVGMTVRSRDVFGDDAEQPLPLKRVVMFNSGVGFFEHSGEVTGNQNIAFPVNVSDINDLLKSLVVQDRGGGKVTAVNYGSPEPITRTLRTLAIDVTANPSLPQILQQLRGQKIEVTVVGVNQPVAGIVVGTEKRRSLAGKERDQIVETEILNLRTDAGLRSVPFDTLLLTKFLDAKTDQDFQRALALLAGAHQRDQKSIKLELRGNGPRPVSIGYVQEAPVWKTSYRLVLSDEQPPFLQGWAIVENTTAQDWSNVNLTLVSGRPVSFQMDLYQPLFASRPVVAPELHVPVRPRTHEQDLTAKDDEFRAAGKAGTKVVRRSPVAVGGFGGGLGGGGFGVGGSYDGPMGMGMSAAAPMNLGQAVDAAAATEDVGESFRYVIKTPVSLRRSESAMLPIVNDAVKGDKVFVYDPATHAKHPMVAVRLTNATELHLQQGPVTVFEESEYAGDARIADIPPGSTRLVTYALDLDTEVAVTSLPAEKTLAKLSIQKGGLHIQHTETRRHQYVIKNSGAKAKRLLLERSGDVEWPRVTPKPNETTRDRVRFAVMAEPGQPANVTVTEERDANEHINLASLDTSKVEIFIQSKVASPKLRDALKELLAKRTAWAQASEARASIENSLRELAEQEDRTRKNLDAVRKTDSVYDQFLKKLTAQETEIDKFQAQLTRARELEFQKLKEWETLAANLMAE